ncbi:MAG TPA: HupE/UreJ family protein [Kineobactrum sp.]
MTSRGRRDNLLSFFLFACLSLFSLHTHAHLLNMSLVQIDLLPEQQVEMRLELDLMVTAGSREGYYALSLLPEPIQQPQVQAILERLTAAIKLEFGGSAILLEPVSITFPEGGPEQYLDPFSWPRTSVVLRGKLADLPDTIVPVSRVRFLGSFVFEEPIATTLQVREENRSMTRWLVPGQYSPTFDVALWYGDASLADPALLAAPSLAQKWQQVFQYAVIGFQHIIPDGIDHLLFVLGLCLGARSVRSLVLLITLFTLAHTLSLGAMTMGLVAAPSHIVEPLIMVSILWVAVENLWRGKKLLVRYLLVLCFGLIHGLGFAGALRDIGLPAEGLVASLIAFNIGVEIGQLSFIALIMGLLYFLKDKAWYRRGVVTGGSMCVALVAGFWIVRDVLLV